MIHVITTNPIIGESIKKYVDNFVICHLHQKWMIPYADSKLGYQFDVYYQDGMDMDEYEEYLNEPNFEYNFIPVAGITQALDEIAKCVMDIEVDLELDAEDDESDKPDNVTLALACHEMKINRQVCRYLNVTLKEHESEIKCLDLYQYMKVTKIEKIEELVKMHLQTDFVYPDDPVAFGYCLCQILNGVII